MSIRRIWAACGIQGYLLSRPDNWQLRVTDLCRRGNLGRDSIYKLLKELQEHGYISFQRHRNTQGQYRGGTYYVHEAPLTEKPDAVKPSTATPNTASPQTVKQEALTNKKYKLIPTTTYTPSSNSITTTTLTNHSSSRDNDLDYALTYPKDILSEEQNQAEKLVKQLTASLAQQVIDEWAGIIATNTIRSSKLGCLRGIVNRAKEGRFTPEKGLRIAAARQRQQQIQLSQTHASTKLDSLPAPNPNNPIIQRMNEIAKRQQNKNPSE